ncbi:hypothetical protein PCANC_17892 [Puccinia coronata f. sp. avenae]|uniref:Uncharacterized protein n=1 Tax=Puccinia coronata f. sp. avenae TaxID=200324 RepID=A0A2N5SKJ0_9BASI|nr:hypothetical protein PCANC_17892 [Puccinia coronata f. sp. avenae]
MSSSQAATHTTTTAPAKQSGLPNSLAPVAPAYLVAPSFKATHLCVGRTQLQSNTSLPYNISTDSLPLAESSQHGIMCIIIAGAGLAVFLGRIDNLVVHSKAQRTRAAAHRLDHNPAAVSNLPRLMM